MTLSDFDYILPKELIAQYPSQKRGEDRLLVVDRQRPCFEEKKFSDILELFDPGDILVANDTKVMPARLYGKRSTGGKVEIFVIDRTKRPVEALLRPSAKIKVGEKIILDNGDEVVVGEYTGLGRLVEFQGEVDEVIACAGHIPLPPYIDRPDEESDRERYQTVFAKNLGATASPTAGLHFTDELLKKLNEKGVKLTTVTLHVSYGTFQTIKDEDFIKHKMHSEYYRIEKDSIMAVKEARDNGNKIWACGTTSVRVLEACADKMMNYIPGENDWDEEHDKGMDGFTDIFIYPGYKFRVVDRLITNFHLPKSSLMLLTSALCGRELLLKAYEYAKENKFRFFSYGDAMVIL